MAWFQLNFFSQCLSRPVNVQVLLPADMPFPTNGNGAAAQPFKTLYLLHGYMGGSGDWLLNAPVNELSQQYGLAVIMPPGDNGFYVDQPTSGVRGGEFIGRELVEYTRSIFPLSTRREDTLIGGLSMGGYGALRNGLRYSEVFGHVIGLSPAIATDVCKNATDEINPMGINRRYYERLFGNLDKVEEGEVSLRWLARELLAQGAGLPDVYFACGYQDMLSHSSRDLHRYWQTIGFPHTYEEGPGSHEWAFWRLFLRRGLTHALGEPPHTFAAPFTTDNYDPEFDVIGRG